MTHKRLIEKIDNMIAEFSSLGKDETALVVFRIPNNIHSDTSENKS